MYTAVNGIYKDGNLILTEIPPTIKESKVVVLFLGEQDNTSHIEPSKGVKLGSLAGQYTIPDNFNDPLDDLREYM